MSSKSKVYNLRRSLKSNLRALERDHGMYVDHIRQNLQAGFSSLSTVEYLAFYAWVRAEVGSELYRRATFTLRSLYKYERAVGIIDREGNEIAPYGLHNTVGAPVTA